MVEEDERLQATFGLYPIKSVDLFISNKCRYFPNKNAGNWTPYVQSLFKMAEKKISFIESGFTRNHSICLILYYRIIQKVILLTENPSSIEKSCIVDIIHQSYSLFSHQSLSDSVICSCKELLAVIGFRFPFSFDTVLSSIHRTITTNPQKERFEPQFLTFLALSTHKETFPRAITLLSSVFPLFSKCFVVEYSNFLFEFIQMHIIQGSCSVFGTEPENGVSPNIVLIELLRFTDQSNFALWPIVFITNILTKSRDQILFLDAGLKKIEQRLEKDYDFTDKSFIFAAKSVLLGFLLVSQSPTPENILLMRRYYISMKDIFNYAVDNMQVGPNDISNLLFVYFPLSSLFIQPEDFSSMLQRITIETSTLYDIFLSDIIHIIMNEKTELFSKIKTPLSILLAGINSQIKPINLFSILFKSFHIDNEKYSLFLPQDHGILAIIFQNAIHLHDYFVMESILGFLKNSKSDGIIGFLDVLLDIINNHIIRAYFESQIGFADIVVTIISESLKIIINNKQHKIYIDLINRLEQVSVYLICTPSTNLFQKVICILKSLQHVFIEIDQQLCFHQFIIEYKRINIHNASFINEEVIQSLKSNSFDTKCFNNVKEQMFLYFERLSAKFTENLTPNELIECFHFDTYSNEKWVCCLVYLGLLIDHRMSEFIDFVKKLMKTNSFLSHNTSVYLPLSLNHIHSNKILSSLYGWCTEIQSGDLFIINDENSRFIEYLMKFLHLLFLQDNWKSIIGDSYLIPIIEQIVSYCDLVSHGQMMFSCAQMITSLLKYNNLSCSFNTRIHILNSLFSWVAMIEISSNHYERCFISLCDAILMFLNGIDLSESIHKLEYFILCLRTRMRITPSVSQYICPVLSSIFKSNFILCSNHALVTSLFDTPHIRSVYIDSLSSSINKQIDRSQKPPFSFLSSLFRDNFILIKSIIKDIPISIADSLSLSILEGSILCQKEFSLIETMIDFELGSVDEKSKNSIFRGNGLASKIIGHFPKVFSMEWAKSMLKGVFAYLYHISNINLSYQINPNKIGNNDDLKQNQDNFEIVLRMLGKSIINGFETIPVPMIKAMKMIFSKISERFEDHGLSILFGFTMLRFIIPIISIPSQADLVQGDIPENIRQCLVTASGILMASLTKGSLDEKSQNTFYLNSFAITFRSDMTRVFLEIVNRDIPEVFNNPISLEEDQISKKIAELLHSQYSSIEKVLNQNGIDQEERQSFLKFILDNTPKRDSQVMSKSEILNSPLYSNPTQSFINIFDADMDSSIFPLLNSWFYKCNNCVYFINQSNQNFIDTRSMLYHLFGLLSSATGEFLIISDFSFFDTNHESLYREFFHQVPAKLIDRCRGFIVLNCTKRFSEFLNGLKNILPKSISFKSIKSLEELYKLVEPNHIQLSKECLEILSVPLNIYNVSVNGEPALFRIHSKSIQICFELPSNPQTTLHHVKVIFNDQINRISDSQILKSNAQFSIFLKNIKTPIEIMTPSNITLHSYISLFMKSSEYKSYSSKDVYSSQLPLSWICFIISVLSMVDPIDYSLLKQSSINLLKECLKSHSIIFPMKESFLINTHSNPSALAKTISESIAHNNEHMANLYIEQFLKIVQYISRSTVPMILFLLSPWIRKVNESSVDQFNTISHLVSFSVQNPSIQLAFNNNIWMMLVSKESVSCLQNIIYNSPSVLSLNIVLITAKVFPSLVSQFWIGKYGENYQSTIFAMRVIRFLISNDLITDDIDYAAIVYHSFSIIDSLSNETQNKVLKLVELSLSRIMNVEISFGLKKHQIITSDSQYYIFICIFKRMLPVLNVKKNSFLEVYGKYQSLCSNCSMNILICTYLYPNQISKESLIKSMKEKPELSVIYCHCLKMVNVPIERLFVVSNLLVGCEIKDMLAYSLDLITDLLSTGKTNIGIDNIVQEIGEMLPFSLKEPLFRKSIIYLFSHGLSNTNCCCTFIPEQINDCFINALLSNNPLRYEDVKALDMAEVSEMVCLCIERFLRCPSSQVAVSNLQMILQRNRKPFDVSIFDEALIKERLVSIVNHQSLFVDLIEQIYMSKEKKVDISMFGKFKKKLDFDQVSKHYEAILS